MILFKQDTEIPMDSTVIGAGCFCLKCGRYHHVRGKCNLTDLEIKENIKKLISKRL